VADLSIDLERLEALQADMRVVRKEFDEAEEFSQTVADLVGHDRLAGVVRDFASKWNLRRAELLEELDYLAEAAKTIRDTMIELDKELSSVLTHSQGHSQGAPPSPGGGSSPSHSQGGAPSPSSSQGGGGSQGGAGSPDASHSQGASQATHTQGAGVSIGMSNLMGHVEGQGPLMQAVLSQGEEGVAMEAISLQVEGLSEAGTEEGAR
jgi:hypothetical protein